MTTPLNFMLLVGEDVGRHQGCYADAFARTPHIDRLAAQGCRFTNAYSIAPVCAPARSALITGQDPRKIGTHLMRSKLLNPPTTFTQDLRDAGYHVNWTNKTDFNFEPTDELADVCDDWREDLSNGNLPDKPWFLYMNFSMTHESGMWPPQATPTEPAPEPRADDASLDELPGLVVPPYLPDTRTTRASLVRYYEKLEEQDREIGKALDALEKSGQADNTVVIYMSDHGRGLVREKRWCFDAGVHMPLIVRGPEHVTRSERGSVRDDVVSWVDMAPTFHSLAGLEVSPRFDGRVFLGDGVQAEPGQVFFGRDRMDETHDKVRGAASRRYHYVRNDRPDIPYAQFNAYMGVSPVTQQVRDLHAAGELPFPANLWMQPTKAEEELFDKVADPYCVHNLANNADHAAILQEMRSAVASWCENIADRGALPERRLVESGLIADQIEFYDARVSELPAEHDPATYRCRWDPDRV